MMTPPNPPHAAHDRLLISAFVAGDLAGRELEAARSLIDGCAACAELAGDLRAIRSAALALPAPARPIDFRLTEADAARLRRSGWRGIAAAIAGPRLAFTRPLAGGLVAIGFAGILLAALPGFTPFTAPATPAEVRSALEPSPTAEADAAEPEFLGTDNAAVAVDSPPPPEATLPPFDTAAGTPPAFDDPSATQRLEMEFEEPGPTESLDTAAGRNGGEELTDGFYAMTAEELAAAESAADRTAVVFFGSLAILGLGLFLLRWLARGAAG